MKKPPPSSLITIIFITIFVFSLLPSSHALGSATTITLTDNPATVCGIITSQSTQRIDCYRQGKVIPVSPNVSFSSISGGRTFFCGLRSGNFSLHCWDTSSSFQSKRLYVSDSVLLENLAVGDSQVCATVVGVGTVRCWRTNYGFEPTGSVQFASISSGSNFSCGIVKNGSQVRCWGEKVVAQRLQNEFRNISMLSIVAGGSHVCGLNSTGVLVCKGSNEFGQLDVPKSEAFEFADLALGDQHSCAIRRLNGSVVCWGGKGKFSVNFIQGVSFELIVSGSNFICGLLTANFSVICWGPGWSNANGNGSVLPLPRILPGPCVQSSCSQCGLYPDSQSLCSTSTHICKPNTCVTQITNPPPLKPPMQPPRPPLSPHRSSRSKTLTRGLLVFAIVGSVGSFIGICTIVYCLWSGVCFGKKKVHNSVQPTVTRGSSNSSSGSASSIKSAIMRQGSRIMRRQRSGPSSTKHQESAEEFSLSELIAATNNFAFENKIGAGSFGVVYRGKLVDGRDVAIKRGETSLKVKKFQEKESAFESELAFLSRLHHKHLVRLVGFCDEKDERLLVYEYMKNGSLHSHLHDKNNVEKSSNVLNSWKMRIKIALDAARGIEYLHNYAVPSIIHRDIKSSNILLDSTWTARVSDFGLSLMSPESDTNYKPTKTAGTVGYIDPEYYGLNVLTAKSDVYGLGVVLLELLTGKRAIFRHGENGGNPLSLVDFAVPAILAGELVKILDSRVGSPSESNESEAVELMAYTAIHCVNLEGKDRPTMADIVANLERAFVICDAGSNHEIETISSVTITVVSD